jgi:UDP:flavonoid glycosyltransferase YjiC (YdhE family)
VSLPSRATRVEIGVAASLHASKPAQTRAGRWRALAHGKPLLLLPLGRDQQFNAGRVVELGAGTYLPSEASPGEIASALVGLLTQPHYSDAATDAATAIAADDPDETATEALLSLAHLAN